MSAEWLHDDFPYGSGVNYARDQRIKNPWALKAAELGIPAPVDRNKCTSPGPKYDCWAGTLEPFTCAEGYRVQKTGKTGKETWEKYTWEEYALNIGEKRNKIWEEYTCCSAAQGVGCDTNQCTSPAEETAVHNFPRVNEAYDCWAGDSTQPLTCENGYETRKTGNVTREIWEEYTCCSADSTCDPSKCTSPGVEFDCWVDKDEPMTCAPGYHAVSPTKARAAPWNLNDGPKIKYGPSREGSLGKEYTCHSDEDHPNVGNLLSLESYDEDPYFQMYLEFMQGHFGFSASMCFGLSHRFRIVTLVAAVTYPGMNLVVLFLAFLLPAMRRNYKRGAGTHSPHHDLSLAIYEEFRERAIIGAKLQARASTIDSDGFVAPEGDSEQSKAVARAVAEMEAEWDRYMHRPTGLKWEIIGTPKLIRPGGQPAGYEITNPELSLALASKTEFTEEEFHSFGVEELDLSDFIKSGEAYFKPVDPREAALDQAKLAQAQADLGITTERRTPAPMMMMQQPILMGGPQQGFVGMSASPMIGGPLMGEFIECESLC